MYTFCPGYEVGRGEESNLFSGRCDSLDSTTDAGNQHRPDDCDKPTVSGFQPNSIVVPTGTRGHVAS